MLTFLIGIKSMILEAKSDPLMIALRSPGINALTNNSKKKIWINIFYTTLFRMLLFYK